MGEHIEQSDTDEAKNDKRQRNVSQGVNRRNITRNRMQKAGRVNPRGGIDARRISGGRNGSGRRRLYYFHSDVHTGNSRYFASNSLIAACINDH